MDFITKHPRTARGVDSIWVIMDRLTKSALLNRDKMGALGQSVNDDPDRIHSLRGPGKLCDKIHRDIFPLPQWNVQRLHLAMRPLMFGLDLPAGQAPLDVPCHIPLHAGPPIV